jgi:hypothetical protein
MNKCKAPVLGILFNILIFSVEAAGELVKRLEIHNAPKQGSWLNITVMNFVSVMFFTAHPTSFDLVIGWYFSLGRSNLN